MALKPLFDAAELLKETPVEKVLTLTRIEAETSPTITIKIDDKVREKERKLFKKYNQFVMRFEGKNREGHLNDDRLAYAQKLIDLCVIDSSGLFENHSNDLLKRACLRQPAFMGVLLDAISEAFAGDVKLVDEDESKKN